MSSLGRRHYWTIASISKVVSTCSGWSIHQGAIRGAGATETELEAIRLQTERKWADVHDPEEGMHIMWLFGMRRLSWDQKGLVVMGGENNVGEPFLNREETCDCCSMSRVCRIPLKSQIGTATVLASQLVQEMLTLEIPCSGRSRRQQLGRLQRECWAQGGCTLNSLDLSPFLQTL